MRLYILLTFVFFINTTYAVSAFPGELNFKQNDGTNFQGHLVGDEWLNYVSLENDYVAIYNKENKNYEYALIKVVDGKNELVSSGIKVETSLHLNNPDELSKTIHPLDRQALSKLDHKKRNVRPHNTVKDKNASHINKKILNTKSTQWKEVLKQKSPSK